MYEFCKGVACKAYFFQKHAVFLKEVVLPLWGGCFEIILVSNDALVFPQQSRLVGYSGLKALDNGAWLTICWDR